VTLRKPTGEKFSVLIRVTVAANERITSPVYLYDPDDGNVYAVVYCLVFIGV